MIRLFTTTLFLTTLLLGTSLSQRSVDKFIDNNKDYDNGDGIAMTIPGWLIRSGMNFAEKFAEDEDEKAYLSLGQYIKKLRFLAIEENSKIKDQDIDWLIRSLKKEKMDEFVTIRSEDANVNVWVKERDDIVEDLVVMVREDESFALVKMKTELPLDALKKTNFSFNSKNND